MCDPVGVKLPPSLNCEVISSSPRFPRASLHQLEDAPPGGSPGLLPLHARRVFSMELSTLTGRRSMTDRIQESLSISEALIQQIIGNPLLAPPLRDRAIKASELLAAVKTEFEAIGRFVVLDPMLLQPSKATLAGLIGSGSMDSSSSSSSRISGEQLANFRGNFWILDKVIRWGGDPESAHIFGSQAFST